MEKNMKELFKYLGIIFLSLILAYDLPHDSYSISQYIVKPIRFENSVLYLAELIPLAMLFIGIRGLCRLEWFAGRSKILITLVVLILVLPIMRGTLDMAKTIYLSNLNGGLRSIDLKDVDLNLPEISDNEVAMNIKLELRDYDKNADDFKIRMYLPDSFKACFNKEFIDFEESYKSFGRDGQIFIDKQISVQLADGITSEDVRKSHWYWETFEFELSNDIESSRIIYHGI